MTNFLQNSIVSGLLIGLLCIGFVQNVEFYKEKPSFLHTCKIYEPGFTNCSTHAIQALMTAVVKGDIPEFKESFGPIDPMKLDSIVFKQDNNEVATIRADITDLLIKGFNKITIKESKVSKKDFSWQTKIFLPNLLLDGKYKMDGRILLLPLNGSGNIMLNIENLDILMFTKTRLYEKGDFTFYNVTNVRVGLGMTGLKVNLDNLFNGHSKEVERSTNVFFNENWRDFFEALRPLITEAVERILLNFMQKLFNILPANFLVEDIPTSEKLYGKKTK